MIQWIRMQTEFDVIIVGGSYAGLSAAMALGRSLRNVLVLDSGMPCNRQTPHSHNFLTQDGETPGAIAEKARAQLLRYGTVVSKADPAVAGRKYGGAFVITTRSGMQVHAPKLIFATGIKDILPSIPGFSDCWGISAVHCPYCHGYELRGYKTAIMANGERAMHLAALVSNLTQDVTVLTSGRCDFAADQINKFAAHKIDIIETPIRKIEHEEGHVAGLVFHDGTQIPFQAVYAAVPFKQHCEIPVSIGCELTEHGYLKVDGSQKTSVEGVFACGDNCSMMRSVSNAVHTGNLAGATVNRELTMERF